MQNLLDELKQLLGKDDRLVVDDELLKNKVIELALKLDPELIRLLLSEPPLRRHFFTQVDQVQVFDKEKFIQFVSNKAFLPDSYTAFANKIGLTDDDGATYLSRHRDVVLVWPYKDCVLEGGQTEDDVKRDEVFWNETLAPDDIDRLLDPKALTNFRRIDANGEHRVKDIADTDNLIVKGNNLLALHSLLPRFGGRVKFIYIDPPYNTGNDSFRYNDRFNHSTWLTFIRNRLEIARDLLKVDGALFVSCDDNEQAYLKVLCDEVFGRENFIACMPWKGRGGRQDAKHVADIHEFVLFYSKNSKSFVAGAEVKEGEAYDKFDTPKNRHCRTQLLRKWGSNSRRQDRPNLYYPIQSPDGRDVYPLLPDGSDGCWRWSKNRMKEELEAGNIEFVEQEDSTIVPYQKIYAPPSGEQRTKTFTTWIETDMDFWLDDVGSTAAGSKELKTLFGYKAFDYPKPTSLIRHLLKLGNLEDDDIALDFFAGSGTTGHAILDLNQENGIDRRFILCEQMDYAESITVERVNKVIQKNGDGSFVYCELMRWNARYVEQIQAARSADELRALWKRMQERAFLSYKVNPDQFDEHADEFAQLSLVNQKRFLLEVLDKNQLYVNMSEIDDADYQVSDEDRRLNRQFYSMEQD